MFSVYSIFDSIDGEVNAFHQGVLTTFIRFSGCQLRCKYCDTQYALKRESGSEMNLSRLFHEVYDSRKHYLHKVTITGGEPLLQEDLPQLLDVLLYHDISISIETNGAKPPLSNYLGRPQISWVFDFKLENSGQRNRMVEDNFRNLTTTDFVKFVVSDRMDVEEALWAGSVLRGKGCQAKFAFSPVHGQLRPEKLLQYLQQLGDGDEIINLQLHKYIWSNSNEEH